MAEQKNRDANANNFNVILTSDLDEDTTLVSSVSIPSVYKQKTEYALSTYDPKNSKYSVYLNDDTTPSKTLTVDEIDDLLTNTQTNLTKVLKINDYNRKLVNKNDIVGKTVESIDTNINTKIKITYSRVGELNEAETKKFEECKELIKDFNDAVKCRQLTRNAIVTPYIEGNWIAYLRHDDVTNYAVDIYPLGVCEISDYEINGDPIVLFNIKNLRNRLKKTYRKTKKNKYLFFKDMNEEVKRNYPPEVYEAFKNGEEYAKLDSKYTGVIRINSLGRKYGVSPITRAYMDLNMLDTFADSDRINSKAKAKKIIHQKMRKEVLGNDYNKDYFPDLAYAHENFMLSWSQPTVVVTSPPTVELISYVEPKVEMTSKDTYNIYRSKVLSTLGIQFLTDSGSQSVSTASISVTQLMRTINSISEQYQDILKKWYRQIIIDNNYSLNFIPDVEVIDSEMLEADLKQSLVSLLFSKLNCSYTTAFEILGLDINDELAKRKVENDGKYDEIFTPHGSQYTTSSNGNSDDNGSGRPTETNDDDSKQLYDKVRNDAL